MKLLRTSISPKCAKLQLEHLLMLEAHTYIEHPKIQHLEHPFIDVWKPALIDIQCHTYAY